jgi:hypothetical protein
MVRLCLSELAEYYWFGVKNVIAFAGSYTLFFMLSADDADIVVQAGARWEDINLHLKEQNIPLFFPVRFPHAILLKIS